MADSVDKKAPRPLKWIREAPSEEICEAMLVVDPRKAVEIAGLILAASGRHLGAKLDRVAENPDEAMKQFMKAGLGKLFG